MDAHMLLANLQARGIRLIPEGGKLVVEPASRLSDVGRFAIRQSEPELHRILSESNEASETAATPNSRSPLVLPAIRAVIESIEADARVKGWPAELLWNGGFWDCPRGLAAILDEKDEIA